MMLSKTMLVLPIFMVFGFHPLKKETQLDISVGLKKAEDYSNPLIAFSYEWNQPIYQQANTAQNETYLSSNEKQVIWILNLVRYNPTLFLKTVLLNPKCKYYKAVSQRNAYERSLISTLENSRSIESFLLPNELAFNSAQCHAIKSGKKSYVGHERKGNGCKEYYKGECCQYGYADPLSIILELLIDNNVPYVGHRKICMDEIYTSLGVSTQPHKTFGWNTVLDFYY